MLWPWQRKHMSQPGWYRIIGDWFTGAWQQNREITDEDVRMHFAVFACTTLIAADISKLRCRLKRRDNGIYAETTSPTFTPVLERPNSFQTRAQFWESWLLSKLGSGNTYAIKERDQRGNVRALYILDPQRVQVLVSDSGDVFYRLETDALSGITEDQVTVPASEIIHDRYNTLYHPLVGLSPVMAAALSAKQSLQIQRDSLDFFRNRAMPGGILIAPGAISDDTAKRLQTEFQAGYGGGNKGRIAALGDGLKFEPMRVTSTDSQMIEQLRWTADVVCSVFHVPPYKIGVAPPPAYNNVQALNVEYYSQALQKLIEDAEATIAEGIGLPSTMEIRFDVEGLLRMDTDTQVRVIRDSVAGGIMSPNEGRQRLNLPPVTGGDTPYLQQQMWSLEQLGSRTAPDDGGDALVPDQMEQSLIAAIRKRIKNGRRQDR